MYECQLVCTDSTDLPNNFPLTGNELLQFKFGTGTNRYYDFEKHLWLSTK